MLVGVLGFYYGSSKSGSVSVQTLILSFNSTTNKLLGTKLVTLKLTLILAFNNNFLNIFIKLQ